MFASRQRSRFLSQMQFLKRRSEKNFHLPMENDKFLLSLIIPVVTDCQYREDPTLSDD
jgi:hypothetical protein